jgi:hypothetical protein
VKHGCQIQCRLLGTRGAGRLLGAVFENLEYAFDMSDRKSLVRRPIENVRNLRGPQANETRERAMFSNKIIVMIIGKTDFFEPRPSLDDSACFINSWPCLVRQVAMI